MFKTLFTHSLTILIGSTVLLGCSSTSAPVTEEKAGTIKRERIVEVQTGMVTGVKKVTVLGKRNSAGNTVGRTVGSIAGGTLGVGYGSVAGSIIGGVLGGVAGSSADKELQKKAGLEISVRLDTGQRVTVTQLAEESFRSGDRVKLIMEEGQAHVTHR
ncbi:MAG TPA: hypothetical protein ENI84_02355 [Thiothrix sp.]|nr:hypothetical protein [Thiothrix sp.]